MEQWAPEASQPSFGQKRVADSPPLLSPVWKLLLPPGAILTSWTSGPTPPPTMCAIQSGSWHPLTIVKRVSDWGGAGLGGGGDGHSHAVPPPHGLQGIPPGHSWGGVEVGLQHALLLGPHGSARGDDELRSIAANAGPIDCVGIAVKLLPRLLPRTGYPMQLYHVSRVGWGHTGRGCCGVGAQRGGKKPKDECMTKAVNLFARTGCRDSILDCKGLHTDAGGEVVNGGSHTRWRCSLILTLTLPHALRPRARARRARPPTP